MIKERLILIIAITITILVLTFFPSINSYLNSGLENSYSYIKGADAPDSNIIIIHISADDIKNLGSWPLKRSYYALLFEKLSDLEVEKIGLEIFLSENYPAQEIYNSVLLNSIEGKENIVLASIGENISFENHEYLADNIILPGVLNDSVKVSTGHLNFIQETGLIIPSKFSYGDKTEYSFSSILAGIAPKEGEIKVNFVSEWESFKSFSLLEFFELFEIGSSELQNFRNKLIIIGVSDPLISKSVTTVFNENLPGLGIHAFAVDNLINDRFINSEFLDISLYIFYLFIIIYLFISRNTLKSSLILLAISIIAFYFIWNYIHLQLNYSAFIVPLVVVIASQLYSRFFENKELLSKSLEESLQLKHDLVNKENKLFDLRKELQKQSSNPSEALVLKIKRLEKEINQLRSEESEDSLEFKDLTDGLNFEGIIYKSPKMLKVVEIIKKVAPENASVLILGESGSGKELVAHAIHNLSRRKNGNFVALNCAALPDNLLESELFGHVKGAFTDAVNDKRGRFEEADKGTLFLDEIGETSENFQTKLLRVLQTGDFQRLGSPETKNADVRILAATNKNLEKQIADKRFREDLYYRLNVIKIELPTLAERKEDIPILANHFVKNEDIALNISTAVMKKLVENQWKGNIRELESTIKRAAIFAKSDSRKIIKLKDLPENLSKLQKEELEEIILDSLREKKFSHSAINETAEELGGINRTVVSENFRGAFFKVYSENSFDLLQTVLIIAGTEDNEITARVESKFNTYLSNIEKDIKDHRSKTFEDIKNLVLSKYKNLPQRYHVYLDAIIRQMTAN